LGAPAGYVGYRESTPLADQLKTHPHSIILFDEIEKAHEDVHRLLLQILDTGTLTDATGVHLDFSHAIIVLTSNIGNAHFDGSSLGFAGSRSDGDAAHAEQTKKLLEEKLSRELVGRLGTIALFHPLTKTSLEAIAQKELHAIASRLGIHQIQTIISPSITKAIIKKAPAHANARDVIHLVEKEIEHLVLERLMHGTKSAPRRMTIAQKKDGSFYVR
jgi:ATP-dependent Clp protease ATP-binding subunit ClpC